ncbi:hypothetical protein [Brachybacterium alimentarium]|uniref:hypothetical protein n=1 Tax=Brachybacterium alimentarium TaxID=47845 RepID=UPI000DF450D5|nr:hypothetical protein [Brachybacterium alimentarium]RCS75495.1 hypothetical protein CIK72_17050 [Brachybacterium alimentarium]
MGFWTKPIGEILEERKDKKAGVDPGKKYKPMVFGTMKTGFIDLKRDGRMAYHDADSTKPTRFQADDVERMEIEDANELDKRVSVARAGGGALVGGVLLGPIGLLAGLGLGAMAKKERGGEKFLVMELHDGRTIIAQIAHKHVMKAHDLRNQFRS